VWQQGQQAEATITNANCPRLNGHFVKANACDEYIDCRSGVDFTNACPAHNIFLGYERIG
jgi:hypothetical protein